MPDEERLPLTAGPVPVQPDSAVRSPGSPSSPLARSSIRARHASSRPASAQFSALVLPDPIVDAEEAADAAAAYPVVADAADGDVKPLPRPDLTVVQKLLFAVASFPAGLISNIKGFFLNTFLLEVAQLNPYLAGVLLLATKAIDALTDPIVGRLSDRTRSRWGRRRPFLLFGALPLALAWFGLWMVPPGDMWGRFGYYLVMVVLVDTMYTVVHIPYTAMASEICTHYDERTTLTTFQMMSTILGGVIPPFVHSKVVEAFPLPNGEYNYVLGYTVSAVVMAVLILGLTLTTFFGTASARSVQHEPEHEHGSFLRNVLTCIRFTPFLKVMLMFLLSNLSIQFIQNNLLLYTQIVLEAESSFSYLLLTIEISTLLNLVLCGRLAARFSKKSVYVAGNCVLVCVVASLYYLPARMMWAMYVLSVVAGVGVAVGLLIPWSMLPDCIDAFELAHGQRYEGVFYAVFVLFQKGALALGMGLSNFVLAASGFITPPPEHALLQPARVRSALRMLLGPVPAALLLLSLAPALLVPISRARHAAILQRLHVVREERARTVGAAGTQPLLVDDGDGAAAPGAA